MDIVERLRDWCEDPHDVSMGELAKYSHDAANEIEQLRKLEARYWEFASKYDSLLIDVGRLREALDFIAEGIDVGRHDGLSEDGPAHDADTMFAVARAALNIVMTNFKNGD